MCATEHRTTLHTWIHQCIYPFVSCCLNRATWLLGLFSSSALLFESIIIPTNTKLLLICILISPFTLPFLTKLTRIIRGPSTSLQAPSTRSHSMAWRSSGSSNEALITNLERNGLIESDRVKEAMLKV